VAAAELLADVTGVAVPTDVSDRLVQSTAGNPLALVELPSVLTREQLSGRQPLPQPLPLTDGVGRADCSGSAVCPGTCSTSSWLLRPTTPLGWPLSLTPRRPSASL
jgi:hypothetical protein